MKIIKWNQNKGFGFLKDGSFIHATAIEPPPEFKKDLSGRSVIIMKTEKTVKGEKVIKALTEEEYERLAKAKKELEEIDDKLVERVFTGEEEKDLFGEKINIKILSREGKIISFNAKDGVELKLKGKVKLSFKGAEKTLKLNFIAKGWKYLAIKDVKIESVEKKKISIYFYLPEFSAIADNNLKIKLSAKAGKPELSWLDRMRVVQSITAQTLAGKAQKDYCLYDGKTKQEKKAWPGTNTSSLQSLKKWVDKFFLLRELVAPQYVDFDLIKKIQGVLNWWAKVPETLETVEIETTTLRELAEGEGQELNIASEVEDMFRKTFGKMSRWNWGNILFGEEFSLHSYSTIRRMFREVSKKKLIEKKVKDWKYNSGGGDMFRESYCTSWPVEESMEAIKTTWEKRERIDAGRQIINYVLDLDKDAELSDKKVEDILCLTTDLSNQDNR